MASGSPQRPALLAILGLTARRLVCILSESVFLIGGIIIGFYALPAMIDAMAEADFNPDPIAKVGIEWYWVLLVALAAHILLWPIVPRLLGWFGIGLWWALGVALPLLIVAVPGLFVVGAYASFMP